MFFVLKNPLFLGLEVLETEEFKNVAILNKTIISADSIHHTMDNRDLPDRFWVYAYLIRGDEGKACIGGVEGIALSWEEDEKLEGLPKEFCCGDAYGSIATYLKLEETNRLGIRQEEMRIPATHPSTGKILSADETIALYVKKR